MRDQLEQLTAEHMDDPKVGDMFHEMYSFWVKVNGRTGDKVFTREGNSRLDSQWEGTVDEFKKRFAYGSIPGYSVSLYTKPATPPTTDVVLGWQDIETAPKDGTTVLLWWPDTLHTTDKIAVAGYMGQNPDADGITRWRWLNKSEVDSRMRTTKPTHWMPLPDPPYTKE